MWVICLPGFNIFSEVWSVSILPKHVRLPELIHISDCTGTYNRTPVVTRLSHYGCVCSVLSQTAFHTGRRECHASPVTVTCPTSATNNVWQSSAHARQPTYTDQYLEMRRTIKAEVSDIYAALCDTLFHRFGAPLFIN